jgi:hypothetical protein
MGKEGAMRKVVLLTGLLMGAVTGLTIGAAIVGTIVFRRALPAERRDRIRQGVSRASASTLERVKKRMPDEFAPMAVPSGIRHLQEQNEELLTLIREQNQLLREHQQNGEVSSAAGKAG